MGPYWISNCQLAYNLGCRGFFRLELTNERVDKMTYWRFQHLPRARILSPLGWALIGCAILWFTVGGLLARFA